MVEHIAEDCRKLHIAKKNFLKFVCQCDIIHSCFIKRVFAYISEEVLPNGRIWVTFEALLLFVKETLI